LNDAWLAGRSALANANLALIGHPHRVQHFAIFAAKIGRVQAAALTIAQF
jgi:hypothetical protein